MTALILASASPARRALLTGAGLTFDVRPAGLDETGLIAAQKGQVAGQIAAALAAAKALSIARPDPSALVIGADQILAASDKLYQKAANQNEARLNLVALAGKAHHLVSAVCVAQGDNVIWQHQDHATLTMKPLTNIEIDRYLAAAGDAPLRAVGGYELEGLGAWLFDRVEGDYFTVLGLPLLPLLGFLATKGFGP